MVRRVATAVALLSAGCASIQTFESTTDTPLRPQVQREVVDDSLEYVVAANVSGYELNLSVEQSETCSIKTTPRAHRRRYIERRSDSLTTRTTWSIAAIGLGVGAYSYAQADSLAASDLSEGRTTTEYQQYGAGMMLLGAGAAVVGIIDSIRASDSTYDDGVIEGKVTREEVTCRSGKSKNQNVELALPNDNRIAARLDGEGGAQFSLLNIPDAGIPRGAVLLEIGDERIEVSLTAAQRTELRDSLLAEPRSRLAMDILEQRRAACATAVATARSQPDARPPWDSAKATCGDLWTTSLEAELATVDERIAAAQCRERIVLAARSFVEDTGVTIGEMTAELQDIRAACPGAEYRDSLRRLDTKLAATVKELERTAATEARRVAREEARAAEQRKRLERARQQRSFAEPQEEPWTRPTRSCCKVCSTGKACGDSCIAAWKTCRKGRGCACDE